VADDDEALKSYWDIVEREIHRRVDRPSFFISKKISPLRADYYIIHYITIRGGVVDDVITFFKEYRGYYWMSTIN
jgi:hypothetical protein